MHRWIRKFTLLSSSASLLFLSAYQAIASCDDLQARSLEWETAWIGLSDRGTPIPLRNDNSYRVGELYQINYVHRRSDYSGPTVVGIKITYTTEENYIDEDIVRLTNNRKASSFSVPFDEYQRFHTNDASNQDLRFNFHLAEGARDRSIPFTTFDPTERKKQLLYAQQAGDTQETYRSYLLTLRGVASEGSCIPFVPYFDAVGASKALVEFVDLYPHEAGHYIRNRVRVTLK